jgi:zinc and cadmium transporter
VVIAAAFLISIPLGVATAVAVIAHEVPQEIGDFGILLDSGYSKKRAFIYNFLSSIVTLPGALIAFLYLKTIEAAVPYILALSAASFIYIATVDLIPNLHRRLGLKVSISQFILLMAGIGTILFFQHG